MTTLEELRQVPLFKGLTDEELREVLEEGHLAQFFKGRHGALS